MTGLLTAPMSVYQEVILDHYRNPRHAKLSDSFDVETRRVNPTCGDEIVVRLSINEGIIRDLSFDTSGCAISVASASAMAELLNGEPVSEALAAYAAFREMFIRRSAGDESLGDCAVFANLADYPARVNCALLGWKALDQALGSAA